MNGPRMGPDCMGGLCPLCSAIESELLGNACSNNKAAREALTWHLECRVEALGGCHNGSPQQHVRQMGAEI